jgi:predicted nucleotidyltransferase
MVTVLKDVLSSQIRAEIFRLLFGLSETELHVREIQRQSGLTIGTVQQELTKLSSLDLVKSRRDGNRLYYRANKEHPLFSEIHGLVIKTSGLVEVLSIALADLNILLAFIFGSVARDEITASSDIDLMIIGEVSLRRVSSALAGAPEKLGREVNPVVVSSAEFRERISKGEHFVSRVLESPRIFVVGTEHDLETMAE